MSRAIKEQKANGTKIVTDTCQVALLETLPPITLFLTVAYTLNNKQGAVIHIGKGNGNHFLVMCRMSHMKYTNGA